MASVSLEELRKKAFNMLAAVQSGDGPVGKEPSKQDILTVNNLAEHFTEEHLEVHLKPRKESGYRRNLDKFILPKLGRLAIAEVGRADIASFHHAMRKSPYEANRSLEIISKMFNLAEMCGLRADGNNPRCHIKKYPER